MKTLCSTTNRYASSHSTSKTTWYTCLTIAMKMICPFWWKGSNSREKINISPVYDVHWRTKQIPAINIFAFMEFLSSLASSLTRLFINFFNVDSNLIKAIEWMAKLAPYCIVINIQIPFRERKVLRKNIFPTSRFWFLSSPSWNTL